MNNFISVVIPTIDRTVTMLSRAVQSVKNQTLSVSEIIIVDDNLPENFAISSTIIDFCNKNQLIYIYTGHVGAASARNLGINKATGEYIAFLDDDDIWLPNKLCLQMPLFEDSNIGLVYSRGYTINIKNNHSVSIISPYATDSYFKTEVSYHDLLDKNYIGTTTQLVIRKSTLLKIKGFDEQLPSRQDYDLCLRIAFDYRCVGVDKPLFIHYIHSQNQITAKAKINMTGYKLLFHKYKNDIYKIKDAPRKWCYRIMRCAREASAYGIFLKYSVIDIISDPCSIKETLKEIFKHN